MSGIQGITEQDIANYLVNTPGFFDRHAELLSTVQLTSPHGQRAVSLQERQMQMLRERIKGLEHKIIEMIRNGQDNVSIADRLHDWTRRALVAADAAELPKLAKLPDCPLPSTLSNAAVKPPFFPRSELSIPPSR